MGKFVGIACIWLLVLLAIGIVYRFLIHDGPADGVVGPALPKVRLALDGFSGYCLFRSPEFKQRLKDRGLDWQWVDDGADYAKRMRAVQAGETPLAVFTIDTLLTQSRSDPDAAIVMLIDETCGADAMVSYDEVASIDDLNTPEAKLVFAGNTPSEMLVRVIRSHFNLAKLPARDADYHIAAKDSEEVLKKFLDTRTTADRRAKAFVMWEPNVSTALKQPGAKRLTDSSEFRGFLVDVLVAQRSFLDAHPEWVQKVVLTYLELRKAKDPQPSSGGMAKLVEDDPSGPNGAKLSPEQARQVAEGIWWKNTAENYSHFGVKNGAAAPLEPVSDMIRRITLALKQTREPGASELNISRPEKLVDDTVLRRIYGQDPALDSGETIRSEPTAPALNDEQWTRLQPVASLRVEPITFSSVYKYQLTDEAEGLLAKLADELRRWPSYYLRVEGHTEAAGDRDANMALALRRANAVCKYLTEQGIEEHRMRAVAAEPGQGKEVRFVALQQPQRP